MGINLIKYFYKINWQDYLIEVHIIKYPDIDLILHSWDKPYMVTINYEVFQYN